MGIQENCVDELPSVAVVKSASVSGKMPVTVKVLENSDFSGCIVTGDDGKRPCQGANAICLNGPDLTSAMLGCRCHKKWMSIEDALACTNQA